MNINSRAGCGPEMFVRSGLPRYIGASSIVAGQVLKTIARSASSIVAGPGIKECSA